MPKPSTSRGTAAVLERPEEPRPAPELAKLERLVGRWAGQAEIVPVAVDADVAPHAQRPGGVATSCKGGGTYEWVLGRAFLRGTGWHDVGEHGQVHYVEYIAWDAKAGSYRNWWFGSGGEHGQGKMTLDADGKTLCMSGEAVDPQGRSTTVERTMTFVADDTMEWAWIRGSQAGKVKIKGTSRRQR